jgi:predicted N-formylglutamate amidohydrolase
MILKKLIFTAIFTFYMAITAVSAENYIARRPVPIVQTLSFTPVYLRRKPLRI